MELGVPIRGSSTKLNLNQKLQVGVPSRILSFTTMFSSPHTPLREPHGFSVPPPPKHKRCARVQGSSQKRRKIRHSSISYSTIPRFTLLKARPVLTCLSTDSLENTSPNAPTNSMNHSSPLDRYTTLADNPYMHPYVPKTPVRALSFRLREQNPGAFASASPEIDTEFEHEDYFIEQSASPLMSGSSPNPALLDVGNRSDMTLGIFLQSDGAILSDHKFNSL